MILRRALREKCIDLHHLAECPLQSVRRFDSPSRQVFLVFIAAASCLPRFSNCLGSSIWLASDCLPLLLLQLLSGILLLLVLEVLPCWSEFREHEPWLIFYVQLNLLLRIRARLDKSSSSWFQSCGIHCAPIRILVSLAGVASSMTTAQWLFCGHWTIRERAVTFASCEIWSPDDRRRGREFLHGTERDQCQWRLQGPKRRVYFVSRSLLLESMRTKVTARFALLLPGPAEATNLPPMCPLRLLWHPLSTLGSTRSVSCHSCCAFFLCFSSCGTRT